MLLLSCLKVRKEAPSAEMQAKLAQERETRRQNAIKWEEEFQRKELQAKMLGHVQQQEQQPNLASMMLQDNSHALVDNNQTTTTTNHGVNTSKHRRAEGTMAVDPSSYKAVDTTNMNTEQTRDVMKLYSQVRTSPFLGKKPQVRSNSVRQQEEEQDAQIANMNERLKQQHKE